MQKTKTTIALIAFAMMLSIVSVSFTSVVFAAYGPQPLSTASSTPFTDRFYYPTGPDGHPLASEPNKRSYYNPVPAWQLYQEYTGPQPAPSPWYMCDDSGWGRYNASNADYNEPSSAPRTSHIRWVDQYGPGGIRVTEQMWSLNFRLGPREQMSDAYSIGVFGYGGYAVYCITEPGGTRMRAIDEWNGKVVWETKISGTPQFILNSGGGPTIYTTGTTCLGYSLATGNLADNRTFPMSVSMFYNSSKFAQLEIGETELYAPGGVVYSSSGGNAYCYAWSDGHLIWGPTWCPGGMNTLVDDVLCGASQQNGIASGIDAITGELLWVSSFVGGSQSTQGGGYGMFYVPCSDGTFHAFDAHTGEVKWVSRNLTASYWAEFEINVGDGAVLDCNRDGNVYCVDAFTGELRWSFYMGPCPYEPYKLYYGCYGFHHTGVGGGTPANGGGVFYAANGDESIGTTPNMPGQYLVAVDMETGQLLWKYPGAIYGHNELGGIFDGLAVLYDPIYSQVICFGKGNTKIELSTTSSQISGGGSTWITGRITDQSPAQPDTPCVSKESMDAWMAYIHGGFEAPPAGLITGVPVSLVAVDSANHVIDLGTVISDAMGYFKIKWTPPNTEEMYQITASFTEDDSYYSSWALANLAVDSAAASTATAGTAVTVGTTMTTVILAAIVIAACTSTVGVAVLIKTRKHKGGNEK